MPEFNAGLYLPTTYVWDIEQLKDLDPNSVEFKELIVKLYQNLNAVTVALNLKRTGYYITNEFVTGNSYFPSPALLAQPGLSTNFRQSFNILVNFGALPNAGTKSVPHNIIGINTAYTFAQIYGSSFNPTTLIGIPTPFASPTLNENIKITVDVTNVNITTAIDYSGYTNTIVVIEYLKF